jgi:predicted kinase
MWLIVMKGPPGSGKSTIARALSRRLCYPLIDKDDILDILHRDEQVPDVLDGKAQLVGGMSYDVMFRVARRQLLQGLSVICDSPLTSIISYRHAQTIAAETRATLAIVECRCLDTIQWSQRIDARKMLSLPPHHQTDWHALQKYLSYYRSESGYFITHPYLMIDTTNPLERCVDTIVNWLEILYKEV